MSGIELSVERLRWLDVIAQVERATTLEVERTVDALQVTCHTPGEDPRVLFIEDRTNKVLEYPDDAARAELWPCGRERRRRLVNTVLAAARRQEGARP